LENWEEADTATQIKDEESKSRLWFIMYDVWNFVVGL
jgi:hypothetical protein